MRTVLKLVKVARSTYYYWRSLKNRRKTLKENKQWKKPPGYSLDEDGKKIKDEEIISRIREAISGEYSCYGYKKITVYLRSQYKIKINKKKVYRLMRENGLLKPRNRRYAHRRRIDDRKVERPDQMWATDIKYGYIAGSGRTFYIINYIDVFTRELVGSYASYSISTKAAIKTLNKAIKERGINPIGLILRSDNGSQYISKEFEEYCKIKGIYHEFTHARSPEENGHVEAYHGILEEELLSRSEFDSLEEAKAVLADWEDFYNNRRLHWGLKLKTPRQVYMEFMNKTEIVKEKVS